MLVESFQATDPITCQTLRNQVRKWLFLYINQLVISLKNSIILLFFDRFRNSMRMTMNLLTHGGSSQVIFWIADCLIGSGSLIIHLGFISGALFGTWGKIYCNFLNTQIFVSLYNFFKYYFIIQLKKKWFRQVLGCYLNISVNSCPVDGVLFSEHYHWSGHYGNVLQNLFLHFR